MGVYMNIEAITTEGAIEDDNFDGDEHLDMAIEVEPGKHLHVKTVPAHEAVKMTEDEYGGYLVDLSKIPKEATHLYVYRC